MALGLLAKDASSGVKYWGRVVAALVRTLVGITRCDWAQPSALRGNFGIAYGPVGAPAQQTPSIKLESLNKIGAHIAITESALHKFNEQPRDRANQSGKKSSTFSQV